MLWLVTVVRAVVRVVVLAQRLVRLLSLLFHGLLGFVVAVGAADDLLVSFSDLQAFIS